MRTNKLLCLQGSLQINKLDLLKFYSNSLISFLGVIGYLSIAASYYFKPMAILSPLIFLCLWVFTGGLLFTVFQFIYAAYQHFVVKSKSTLYMHHFKGALVTCLSYILLLVGMANDLMVTA
jgi:vacuolar-type H+-ATPase subunit I/STV1